MIKKNLVNHSSLLVIVAGAGGFFLTNIILKMILSPIEFGQFSLLITYFSLMYIFGLFGFEQVFIRLSNIVAADTIKTQSFQIKTALRASLLSSVLGTVFFRVFYAGIEINLLLLFLATYSITNIMFVFTIFRLNSNFFIAQLIANFWKIILFAVSVALFLFFRNEALFHVIKNTLVITIIAGFVVSLYVLRKKIAFVYNEDFSKKEIVQYFIQFFLSILIFSFLSFGDRFIFNELFGIEAFGNYYYLCNFFLAPFSIFQNYIGFKQIVQFKDSWDRKLFDKLVMKIFFFGFSLAIALAAVTWFLDSNKILNFAFHEHLVPIAILLLIGITRLYYAAIAALFEATAYTETIKRVNLYFLLFLTAITLFSFFLVKTINQLIFVFLVIWIFRCFIFRTVLFRQHTLNQ